MDPPLPPFIRDLPINRRRASDTKEIARKKSKKEVTTTAGDVYQAPPVAADKQPLIPDSSEPSGSNTTKATATNDSSPIKSAPSSPRTFKAPGLSRNFNGKSLHSAAKKT